MLYRVVGLAFTWFMSSIVHDFQDIVVEFPNSTFMFPTKVSSNVIISTTQKLVELNPFHTNKLESKARPGRQEIQDFMLGETGGRAVDS